MYGTIARLRLKSGMEDKLAEIGEEIKTSPPAGHVTFSIYRMDAVPDEYYLTAVFVSKEAYHANAGSPAQDVQYRKLRSILVDDPEWYDGEIISTDAAG